MRVEVGSGWKCGELEVIPLSGVEWCRTVYCTVEGAEGGAEPHDTYRNSIRDRPGTGENNSEGPG